jgi:hypothetical protein
MNSLKRHAPLERLHHDARIPQMMSDKDQTKSALKRRAQKLRVSATFSGGGDRSAVEPTDVLRTRQCPLDSGRQEEPAIEYNR